MARECRPVAMSIYRLVARLFVIGGGIFWVTAVFGADWGYRGVSPLISARNALIPLAATLVVLAIGWVFEYLAAGVLVLASVAGVAWGVLAGWEPGVWVLMVTTLIGPMMTAAVLFTLAARIQTACSLQAQAAGSAA
jgi:hypothetical protein